MDYMDPVETARRILNNEPLEETVDVETLDIDSDDELELAEDEGKVPPQFLKKNGKDEDEDDKDDDDKDDDDKDDDDKDADDKDDDDKDDDDKDEESSRKKKVSYK